MTITTQVKIELLADPVLGAQRLDVSTLNGVVTLAGTTPSQTDANRAAAIARRVPGVRAVTSELKIASRYRPSARATVVCGSAGVPRRV